MSDGPKYGRVCHYPGGSLRAWLMESAEEAEKRQAAEFEQMRAAGRRYAERHNAAFLAAFLAGFDGKPGGE